MRKRSGQAVMEPPKRPGLPAAKWLEGRGAGLDAGFDSDDVVVFDPAPLTGDQRAGKQCVSCFKRLPMATIPVGRIPSGDVVRTCPQCAPAILLQVHALAVRHVLRQADARVERCAPNVLQALIAAAPSQLRPGQRRAVEAAAIIVARHVADTEDLGGAELLPRRITEWAHAWAWLTAWSASCPPAAVIREVLAHVLDVLPDALADLDNRDQEGTTQ